MQVHYDRIEQNLSCPEVLGRIIVDALESSELVDHLESLTEEVARGREPALRLLTSESLALYEGKGYTLFLRRLGERRIRLRQYEAETKRIKSHGVFCVGALQRTADVTVNTYEIGDKLLTPVRRWKYDGDALIEDPRTGLLNTYSCASSAWMLRLNVGKPELYVRCFDGDTLQYLYTGAAAGKSSALVTLCSVFAATGDRAAISYLKEIACNEAYFVRWAAIQAIGRLDAGEAMEALRHAASDPHATIRDAARRSLEQAGGQRG